MTASAGSGTVCRSVQASAAQPGHLLHEADLAQCGCRSCLWSREDWVAEGNPKFEATACLRAVKAKAYQVPCGLCLGLALLRELRRIAAALDPALRVPGALPVSDEHYATWCLELRQIEGRGILAILEV